MGVDSRHPLYTEQLPDWRQMRVTHKGQRAVKEAGFEFLPATGGMIQDGADKSTESDGYKAYKAYLQRAHYPQSVRDTAKEMLGILHQKPPVIELPDSMEPLRNRATFENESLEMLLQRINEEQIVTGRLGLLADVIDSGELAGQPYIALYKAEDIVNWDEGQQSRSEFAGESIDSAPINVTEPQNLNFVSLQESGFERTQEFEWEFVQKYRILILGDTATNEPVGEGVYRQGVFRNQRFSFGEGEMTSPAIRGQELSEIPFVFINAKDIVADPDDPPLLGISNLALTIYRGEADYRQGLFAQSQDTLVTMGSADENKTWRLGAGASINLPLNGDAKMIGASSDGLAEQREALANDYLRISEMSTRLLAQSGSAESGEALRIRVGSRTAALNQIALTGAFGLQSLLRIIARWLGADPEQVIVTPNLDFIDDQMTGRDLVDFITARNMGAPYSRESIHALMQRRGLTEKTYEEELDAIEVESEDLGLPASSNSRGLENDEDEPEPGTEDENDQDQDA